jgi:DNA-binding NarL/FixJ family response regulator
MNLSDIEASLQILQLAPDDIIVLSIDRMMTREQGQELREHFRRQIPNHLVIILTDGLKLSVLSRAEIDAMAE